MEKAGNPILPKNVCWRGWGDLLCQNMYAQLLRLMLLTSFSDLVLCVMVGPGILHCGVCVGKPEALFKAFIRKSL